MLGRSTSRCYTPSKNDKTVTNYEDNSLKDRLLAGFWNTVLNLHKDKDKLHRAI
jgi:hypothetical protein